jgi:SAM-dependent methyltransferase
MVINKDIAGKQHWDGIYEDLELVPPGWQWEPGYYHQDATVHALLGEIERSKARSILEVGCGNSVWLPYLARKSGATAYGLDYSERGCELTRRYLRSHGLSGEVWCADLFQAKPEEIGQYDFVYSIGLVEHFSDLEGVLAALLKFVRPGGTLFTLVPNLRSIHGLMTWLWQPELFAKHELIGKRQLIRAHERLGLEDVRGQYLGVFSMYIVAWGIYPRWPALVPTVELWVNRINWRLDPRLRRLGWFRGTLPLAPYVIAVGRKGSEP